MRPYSVGARALSLVVLLLSSGCSLKTTYHRAPVTAVGQASPVRLDLLATILLIGDAGKALTADEPVLSALTDEIRVSDPQLTTVVFLGDNVYQDGVPDSDQEYKKALGTLTAQADAAQAAHTVIFIPGNHDHHNDVENERKAIASLARTGTHFLPCKACWVQTIAIGRDEAVHLVAIDSEAWLSFDGDDGVLREALTRELGSHDRVIVVGHHPLATHGPHGGFYGWRVWEYVRRMGWSKQDLSNPRNKAVRQILRDAFAEHPPLLYASGHEHSLQLLEGSRGFVTAVSGAGTQDRPSPIKHGNDSLLASPHGGFMRLDVYANGGPRLQVIAITATGEKERFALDLAAQ